MPRPRLNKGLVQVYTGDSKGKTTAALGQALRAIGHGFQVCFIQFLKGAAYTGELYAAQRLYPNLVFRQYGITCPYNSQIRQGEDKCHACGKCFPSGKEDSSEFRDLACMAFRSAEQAICSEEFDLVVLDEINIAVHLKFLDVDEVLSLLDKKPDFVEVILTGRNAHPAVLARADLVTEMCSHKHPFQNGIPSRRGIEY